MIIKLTNCVFHKLEQKDDKCRVSVVVNAIQYEKLTNCIAESQDRTYILSFNSIYTNTLGILYYGDIIDVELSGENYKYDGDVVFN